MANDWKTGSLCSTELIIDLPMFASDVKVFNAQSISPGISSPASSSPVNTHNLTIVDVKISSSSSFVNERLIAKKSPLTPEEENQVDTILNLRIDDVVVDAFNIQMTTALLQCCKPSAWLNCSVIGFYMELLRTRTSALRCHFFNSFFFTKMTGRGEYSYANVCRWSLKAQIKIIELDKVFVPIHVGGNHWWHALILQTSVSITMTPWVIQVMLVYDICDST